MDFYELAAKRRSMRQFTDEKITAEQMERLLGAALMAPSSKGRRPWHFVVVDQPELLQQLASCKAQGAAMLSGAAAAVVVLADPSVCDVWIEDASVATTYLLLEAEQLDLGACWVQVRRRSAPDGREAADVVRRVLSVPAGWEVLSIVALGHKGMVRSPFNPERMAWQQVSRNGFGTAYELTDKEEAEA